MKKLIILILICLWAFVETKAQSNYFINSVTGVKVRMQGSGILTNQELTDTSKVATAQRLWFLSPKGYDPGTGNWFQAGMLNVTLTNLSATQWKKVSLYDFTGVNLLYTQNLSPNAIFYWDFDNGKRLDASKDYYWKIEDITSQAISCKNDVKNIPASSFDNIDVLNNDLNLPALADCRLKAGQTLTGGITVIKDQYTGLRVTTSSQQGSFSFVYEAISSNGTVLGEATATITVGNAAQYCTLAILADQLQDGSQTIHEFTMYSPNAQINPFNYEVRMGSFSGTVVKSGTTPAATSSKEIIDFGTLATGTYYVKFSSTVSQCFDIRSVSHIANTDACNASIISIDKVNSTNNYNVNSAFSNVATIKYYLTNAQTSVATPLLTQTNVSTPSFSLDLSTIPNGIYFLNIEGEGKLCKAQKSFNHTSVSVTGGSGGKLETWTKFIHNYKDNWIIAGKNDYESGRDKFGLQTFNEKADNVVWKSFISDFENLGNSPKAKAIIGFRKDTTRNEIGVSVGVTANSIILQQRSERSGATNILATISNVTMPVWIRLTKTGTDLIADYSKDLTMNPVYTQIGRISGAFTGFTKYQKFIGVASAKTDVIATARFQGQLGGNINFNTSTINILSPVIATNVVNPSSGQSISLTTTTACIAPATNMWYKNTQIASFSAGSTVNVQGFNGDSYYARCEIGLNKSIASNVVSFTMSNLVSCNNGTQPFSVSSAVYNNGSITFSFNASNLSNTNYSIINGSTVVATSTVQPTANSTTIAVTSLAAGNYIFKLDGISCNGTAQKAFTVAGAGLSPSITSIPSSPVTGDNLTLTATGCVGNYNFYKNVEVNPFATTTGSTQTNNVQGSDYYYVQCVSGSLNSNYVQIASKATSGSGGTGTVGLLADLNLSAETMWNRFQPDLIPDFTPSTSFDAKTGQTLPNKWFIWHSPYRNLFGSTEYERISKMIKKGVTAFNVSKLPLTPYSSDLQALITPERIVAESYGISGYGNIPEEANYETFAKWASDGVKNVLQYGVPVVNGKYGQLLTINDYEGTYTAIVTQTAANYNSVALNSMANIAVGRVGFQYAAAANAQGLYGSYLYNGSNDNWSTGADSSVPTEFIGKSAASNNRIIGINEITNALESILPEGYQVQDQNNNNWFTIKHFGKELDATYSGGQLDQCNAQHWATNVGVGTETFYQIHKSLPNGGQDFIVQLKNNNETDNGFHYDQRYAQYRNNKYASYVSRYGILNVRDKYVNGVKVGTEEFIMPMGTENITNFMAEGQTMLAYFCGAKGINLWNSDFNDVAIPKPKEGNPRQGAKYNDVNYGNRDLESYNYMLKALWRLNQKVLLSNGQSYSFNEICDGSEVYLNQSTKVVYPGSSTVTQLRALDWQISQKSCVRAVVNTSKNVVFVIAFQAYGVEQNQVTFKLTDYGANITEVIDLPIGKIIVRAYPLVGGTSEGGSAITPSITSNVTSPVAGQSVTLTSSGCQSADYVTKWYTSNEGNLLATGLTYTVNALNGNGYYASCVSSFNSSVASNIITFSIANNSLTPINVFVFVGESNAGTRNANTTLLAGEGGLRTGVRIWNNTNNQLEQLNVGINNYQGENAAVANGWGWEVELANLRANGTINNDFVIVKTAEGGALIGQYNTDISGGYYSIMQNRINGVKNALRAEGKTPTFYVMYSQGINNALYPNIDDQGHFPNVTGINYWQSATNTMLSNLRSLMGVNTKISLMKFFGSYGTYLNGAITNLVNNSSLNSSIITEGLSIQGDGLHLDGPATRTAADRYIATFNLSTIPVPNTSSSTVNVFIMAGESNGGTRNQSSTLLSGEGGVRAGVRIWNNNTNILEPLNIGVNNYLDENDAVIGGWGMENQLANLRRDGVLNSDFIVIKTAQGGAYIESFHSYMNPHPNYYEKTIAKINGVKTALALEGKTPIFYILYTQGINDALVPNGVDVTNFPGLSGNVYWKEATKLFLSKLRGVTGLNTKICLMKFFSPYGNYTNTKIDEMVSENSNNSSIITSDLLNQIYSFDGVHFDQIGTKTVTNRYIAALGLGTSQPVTPTTPPSSTITITEPAKPQYYFSDGHDPSYYDSNVNLPAIHRSATKNNSNYTGRLVSNIFMQSNYSMTNDLVWLSNDKIKVGINLLRGGQVAWLSTVNANENLIYNGYDGGFQVTMDAYQRQDGYSQNGKVSRKNFSQTLQYDAVINNPDNPLTSYNTCMGGDFNNNSQSLISYYPITNGYVVKYRPLFYTFDIEFSQVTIEAKYTLQPGASSVRVDYTYHSFRTDNQFSGGGFDGAAVPSCFIVNTLNRGQTYAGNAPFTNDAIEDTQLPIENNGFTPFARNATERFGCVYNGSTQKTFGLYIPSGRTSEYLRMKQLEVYVGNTPGTEFAGGFTHLDFFQDFANPIPDRSNYTKVVSGYLIATDSPSAARAEAYRLKTLLGN